MVQEICQLCGIASALCESHIIPKFAYTWLKETGTGYLRTLRHPNVRKQDGPKMRLLCLGCEQRFSKKEDWFKRIIFQPYLSNTHTLPYDDQLFYFTISLLWRVMKAIGTSSPELRQYKYSLDAAESEWRQYLLGGPLPSRYNDLHLFLTDIGTSSGDQPVIN